MSGLSRREVQAQYRRTVELYRGLMTPPERAARLTPPVAWRALTEAEKRFCWPVLERLCLHDRGRPPAMDALSQLEACLEAACSGLPWREVRVAGPQGSIKGDTLHRGFRRWSARGVWMALLVRLAEAHKEAGGREPGKWAALEYFVCRAYRRAWRLQGMRGIVLARLLGLRSALRAPMGCLPDPVLSARFEKRFILPGLDLLWRMPRAVGLSFLRVSKRLLEMCRGRARIRRAWEPA